MTVRNTRPPRGETIVRHVQVPGADDPRRSGYAQAVNTGELLFNAGAADRR
ncbi:hypothetical protein [Streptomyces sp. NRRL S-337]|uniref:hypothetical protein n=1 Tax=Streptomyces sp. NRRL S-337 TaxID=1463900 RepID=UPI000B1F679D|nr:hypothetical protein [Streptomyces sp. NRRL S-337]